MQTQPPTATNYAVELPHLGRWQESAHGSAMGKRGRGQPPSGHGLSLARVACTFAFEWWEKQGGGSYQRKLGTSLQS